MRGRKKKEQIVGRETGRRPALSEFRGMWIISLFDLPVDSKQHRRDYTRFRKLLISQGFQMLQFSVYAQYFPSEEASDSKRKIIREGIPTDGQVRLVTITDHQFGKMDIFLGNLPIDAEAPPPQLTLF